MKMLTLKKSLMLAALIASCGLMAAETAEKSEFAKAQELVKAKYPEDYAKIQKLAETDLSGAMEQLRALARKGEITLPRRAGENGRPGERGGAPGADRGGRRGGGERGGGDRGGDRGGAPGGARMGMGGLMGQIKTAMNVKAKFPEEYAATMNELNTAENNYEALANKAGAEVTTPMMRSLRQIEAKDAAGFAEASAMMDSDMRGAMVKFRDLAEKAGVEFGMGGQRGGGQRGGDSEAQPQRPRAVSGAAMMKKLRDAYPEDMKRYDELRKTDSKGAAAFLRELSAKLEKSETAK